MVAYFMFWSDIYDDRGKFLSSSTLFWPRKIKFRISNDIFLFTFSKKNIFAAARMNLFSSPGAPKVCDLIGFFEID